MDLDLPYGSPPKPGYVKSLLDQIALVEDHVRAEPLGATVAHDVAALDAAIAAGRTASSTPSRAASRSAPRPEVEANVADLAQRGVPPM